MSESLPVTEHIPLARVAVEFQAVAATNSMRFARSFYQTLALAAEDPGPWSAGCADLSDDKIIAIRSALMGGLREQYLLEVNALLARAEAIIWRKTPRVVVDGGLIKATARVAVIRPAEFEWPKSRLIKAEGAASAMLEEAA